MEDDRLEKVKVVISEIDGVVTEHLSAIDPMGYIVFKQYCMKDFEAINEIKKSFKFVFISSDDIINFKICRDRNIPFYHNKSDKKEALIKVMQRYSVTPDEVVYIGSTFSDLECIRMIPLSLCPSDSVNDVFNTVAYKLQSPSGMGVLCEVYDLLKSEINRRRKL